MTLPQEKKYTAEELFAYTPENIENRYELFDGKIVMQASPSAVHQKLVMRLSGKFDNYIRSKNGKCQVFPAPFDFRLDSHTVVIPDVSVTCDPSKIDDKRGYGAPDFVIEILSSNRYDDLVRKLAIYINFGVREYWIVDPEYKKTIVYFFERNDFPNIYTFEQEIPVNIYDGELTVNISELLA